VSKRTLVHTAIPAAATTAGASSVTRARPATPKSSGAQRSAGDQERGMLQRKASGWQPTSVAPPIIHDALRAPGQPLDAATRAFMEPRFGFDFSQVRVHADARADESARAVSAQAYTVGRDVVFSAGQYAPETTAGRRLLAHELAHVVQQRGAASPAELEIGAPDTAYEQDASRQGDRVAQGEPAAKLGPLARPAVVQRSLFGGILGGILGAVGGIAIGALTGGLVGAVVGGVAGLIAGAAIGEAASTRSRKLTAEEIVMAREIFQDSIDYTAITITRDSMLAVGAPRTLGNTIHLKSDWGHFRGDTLELTEQGKETLIHEMTHVWQYQNGGLDYIPLSLIAQLRASIFGKDRNAAYDWRAAHDAGLPWEDWNPEQQAAAVEEYNRLLGLTRSGKATAEDYHKLTILLPYIESVRRREGAPGGMRSAWGARAPSANEKSWP
jgi:outer membrane lipoprotein SlyB